MKEDNELWQFVSREYMWYYMSGSKERDNR